MSDLFTEALKNAEKLREIAEQDAKNKLIEALTPYIKQVIAKEAAGSSDFFLEQDDEDTEGLDLTAPKDQQGMAGSLANTAQPDTMDPSQTLSPALGDKPIQGDMSAPISVPGTDDLASASMPDEDGKITVDFEDLFVDGSKDQVTITPPIESNEDENAPLQSTAGTEPTTSPLSGTEGTEVPPAAPDMLGGEEPEEEEEQQPLLPTEAVNYRDFQRVLSNISERIDRAYFSKSLTEIAAETLRQRMFDLLECLDDLRDRGQISNKMAKVNENKLEFLFKKLKEANEHNSYNKKEQIEGSNDMKTLKEFAAQLFEEDENLAKDSVSTGDTGLAVDDEYSKHAADVSGVDPKLGGPKDIKAAQEKSLSEEMKGGTAGSVNSKPISKKEAGEKPWNEGEPSLGEESQDNAVTHSMNENSANANPDAHDEVAEGAAGFGDTNEEPCAEFEIDDEELAEAVRSVRKENIRRKLEALREASDGKEEDSWEDGEPEGGKDPSQKNLKEMALDEMDTDMLSDNQSDSGMMDEDSMMMDEDIDDLGGEEDMDDDLGGVVGDDDHDADLVLSVDLPPEVEQELANLGVEDLDVDVQLNVGGEHEEEDLHGDELGDLGDEDEDIEVVDDEGLEDEDELGSSEEDMLLSDEDEDGMSESTKKSGKNVSESKTLQHQVRKNKLLEKKVLLAKKLLEQKELELENLRKQLTETNLFTSKAVYYSKFLQTALTEKTLNKKALQQIVEHLDKGRSVAETKAIYNKIKRKLDEHNMASKKLGGSSSKVTKPGSASLNESVNQQSTQDVDAQTPTRWQILAGIKKNSE